MQQKRRESLPVNTTKIVENFQSTERMRISGLEITKSCLLDCLTQIFPDWGPSVPPPQVGDDKFDINDWINIC